MSKIPIWSWRHAIMKTDAAQATKHLCHVIACDLSDTGKFTRLSVAELSDAAGISKRSISRHIAEAEAAGLLKVERVRDDKGHVVGTRYYPKFPVNFELATLPAKLADREKPTRQNRIPTSQFGCSIETPSLRPLKKEARERACEAPTAHDAAGVAGRGEAVAPNYAPPSEPDEDAARAARVATLKGLANGLRAGLAGHPPPRRSLKAPLAARAVR